MKAICPQITQIFADSDSQKFICVNQRNLRMLFFIRVHPCVSVVEFFP
jgi:hypothetical protein